MRGCLSLPLDLQLGCVVELEAMNTLYTFGYQNAKNPESLLALAEKREAVFADARFSPNSRNPMWGRARLALVLGERYVHVKALGNRNYKGGPIDLLDPDAGAEQISALLERSNVILLCTCWNVDTCHRKTAAEYVASKLGCHVVHLGREEAPVIGGLIKQDRAPKGPRQLNLL